MPEPPPHTPHNVLTLHEATRSPQHPLPAPTHARRARHSAVRAVSSAFAGKWRALTAAHGTLARPAQHKVSVGAARIRKQPLQCRPEGGRAPEGRSPADAHGRDYRSGHIAERPRRRPAGVRTDDLDRPGCHLVRYDAHQHICIRSCERVLIGVQYGDMMRLCDAMDACGHGFCVLAQHHGTVHGPG